jgi:hypothetical protein
LHAPFRITGRGVRGCGKLKGSNQPASRGKPKSAQLSQESQARGLKGPGVTTVKLETGRSSPGQVEARRKPGGGPIGCWVTIRSVDLGLGAKDLSSPVIASSLRSWSQPSLEQGCRWGRAPIEKQAVERLHFSFKLRIYRHRRPRETGYGG